MFHPASTGRPINPSRKIFPTNYNRSCKPTNVLFDLESLKPTEHVGVSPKPRH